MRDSGTARVKPGAGTTAYTTRERQVEKYNGFWPIRLAKREIFQPVAREARFGARREPLLAQLGGFLGCEAAQHLGKMAQGGGCCVPFCPRATCGGGHAHRCRAHCAAPIARAHRARSRSGAMPTKRGRAVRHFGPSHERLAQTGKSMRYNSRTGVRQPMPFRKHQVDCLRLWRLSSPWILKRILLAIFNIRAGAKMAGGLHAGVFCQVELSKKVDHF